MIETVSKRVSLSKSKLAIVALIAFLTLSFFAIGYSAMDEAQGNSAAVQQPAKQGGNNPAISAFKFV